MPVIRTAAASYSQKLLWNYQNLFPSGTAYNETNAFALSGPVNAAVLADALRHLVERHAALRTTFRLEDGEVVQVVSATDDASPLRVTRTEDLPALLHACINTPFDLAREGPARFYLIETGRDAWVFLTCIHHIVFDGSSANILFRELSVLYNSGCRAAGELEPLPYDYFDYSRAQWQKIDDGLFDEHLRYWQGESAEPFRIAPRDDYRAPRKMAAKSYPIRPAIWEGVKSFCKENKLTPYIYCLGLFNILLHKYTFRREVAVGSVFSNRVDEGFENVVGFFANTLIISDAFGEAERLGGYLQRVKEKFYRAYQYQDAPFQYVLERLNAGMGNFPTDTFFLFHGHQDHFLHLDGIGVKALPCRPDEAKFNLMVTIASEDNRHWHFHAEYAANFLEESTIDQLFEKYEWLIEQHIGQPGIALAGLSLVTPADREAVLAWGSGPVREPAPLTLNRVFGQTFEKYGDRTAILTGTRAITYRELDQKSKCLALHLRSKGVTPNRIVGIMTRRSPEMLYGIYGILRAGGAYLPIDPAYPEDRINFMLEDSGVTLLVTDETGKGTGKPGVELVRLTEAFFTTNQAAGRACPDLNEPRDLAYVIYTSGSTGKPKGVLIEHQSLVNRIEWMQGRYPVGAGDVILQKTPCTFDVSVWELVWWAFTGAGVSLLPDGQEKNPAALAAALRDGGVTVVHFVPSMLQVFLEYVASRGLTDVFSRVAYLFCSGEALPAALVRQVNELIAHVPCQLVNLYGPTEATIDVSYYDCPKAGTPERIPIGKPIDNTGLCLVDAEHQLVPVGVAGELCISGIGLAQGYLNREALNRQKFISHPVTGVRMYKTGDLGRFLPDGNLEYLGRMDEQVKIRGFRIELGEIESAMREVEGVREAVAVAHAFGPGDVRLIACYTANGTVSTFQLRRQLKTKLPEYMIPTHFAEVSRIPLSANGKADRKAIPSFVHGVAEATHAYRKPESPLQQEVAALWSEVLKVRQVGLDDNFFNLGGNSILAIKLVAALQQKTGKMLAVKDLVNSTLNQFVSSIA